MTNRTDIDIMKDIQWVKNVMAVYSDGIVLEALNKELTEYLLNNEEEKKFNEDIE